MKYKLLLRINKLVHLKILTYVCMYISIPYSKFFHTCLDFPELSWMLYIIVYMLCTL